MKVLRKIEGGTRIDKNSSEITVNSQQLRSVYGEIRQKKIEEQRLKMFIVVRLS